MVRLKKKKVFVALSGGVDSSVAALLLKKAGFDVAGIFIKTWSVPSLPCTLKEDRLDAMRVAAKLKIPFTTLDLSQEYKKAVVDYMISEYAKGRTPNPDVVCNQEIKFGIFLKKALEMGADYIATGHYVRLKYDRKGKVFRLFAGKDKNKDQSYFLWTLTQEKLRHCLFPIGDYLKSKVREIAEEFKLPTAKKKDSQGICFLGKIEMREFLKEYIPVNPGPVLVTSGKVIGQHQGLSFYTIGQRRGLGIAGGFPYYVLEKDFATNSLIVVDKNEEEKLFSNELLVSNLNWVSGKEPKFPLKCQARIRYRGILTNCQIEKKNSNYLFVKFEAPQKAPASGQSIVFYQEKELLGGGIIE